MALAADYSGYQIRRLIGSENYPSWLILEGADLWEMIERRGTDGMILAASQDATKNGKARSKIIVSLSKYVLPLIDGLEDAKADWDALKGEFEEKGYMRKVSLVREFCRSHLDDCNSMIDYTTRIT